MSRPRGADGLTVRQRIWTWLMTNGRNRGIYIQRALGLSHKTCCDAMYWLKDKRYVRGYGESHQDWEAVGEVMPPDLRGQSAASIANLYKRRTPHITIHYTGALRKVQSRDFPKRGKPVLALEQMWGYGCERASFPVVQDKAETENVSPYAGETTSASKRKGSRLTAAFSVLDKDKPPDGSSGGCGCGG